MPDGTKNAPTIRLEDLVIETTRRCDMRCEHCLRGGAEDMAMPAEYIGNVLSRVTRIDVLTFTGGEPGLGTDAMYAALDCCRERGISVREVYVATNGKNVRPEFLDALRQWDAYCKESQCYRPKDHYVGGTEALRLIRELTMEEDGRVGIRVDLSMDRFHDDVEVANILSLMSLPGTLGTGKYNGEQDDRWILKTGQAEWNGMGETDMMACRSYAYDERALKLELSRDLDGEYAAALLYVSCDGSIVRYCDYAYRDIPEFALASAGSPDWLEKLVADHYDAEE